MVFSGTKHVILMGYQLPPDDVVWRSAIAAKRSNEEVYCSVVVGHKVEKRWIDGDELMKYVEKNRDKADKADYGINAIEAAMAVFGKDNVRAYTGGIPAVFLSGDDLLYPKKCFPNGIAEGRIKNQLL
jgi:hypothetical protein